ncbi:SusC/RagA family TonB-linked outer membrane protein [Pseudochryseolinea flava]|uniref:SusC/RagA family protein n=1 Tax=Pseudochryseolinea flava TaxID=2059302 RepID=A0A364Y0U7_9BACT|nr:TonB-dependent receptor [Pseudochryseolinea flava]RAW00218.1 SusC/RagA family protein [Pseudochryseolinea flava]
MQKHLFKILTLLLIGLSGQLYAQDRSISGVVRTDDGALPGASVTLKGTTIGTITDGDGRFNVSFSASENPILIVSFIGYRQEEVVLTSGQTSVDITLQADVSTLDEVIVVGYGTKKKVNLTGAVSEVNDQAFSGKPVVNAYQALQGEAAGVIIQQGTSEPGTNPSINIRGLNTINGNNPLVVVDGVIGSLNNVNPNDIKSVTVLKDAASAAIYGSRAASGVILVTTKSGNGAPSFQYSANIGVQQPTNFPDAADSWEYAALRNEALVNSGFAPQFTPEQIADFKENGPNVFHYRELFKHTAPQSNHNFSLNGKNENTDYYISLGYQDQNSLFKGPDYGYTRYNFRMNLTQKVGDKWAFSGRMSFVRNDIKDHAWWTEWLIEPTVRIPTIYRDVDENGNYTLVSGSNGSSLARLEKGGMRRSKNDEALGNFSVEYKPIPSLTVKAVLSGTITSNKTHEFRKAIAYAYPGGGDTQNSVADQSGSTVYLNPFVTANFNKEVVAGGVLDLLVGASSENFKNDFFGVTGINVPGNEFGVINNTSELLRSGTYGTGNEWSLRSYFGRAGFTYQDKYLFEANLRYDGSSRFSSDNRWGFFPSVSAGWVLSKESFFAPVENIISFAKVRGSWGQVGNQDISDLYGYQSLVSVSSNVYGFGNKPVSGAYYSVSNAGRSWETTTMTNIGLDVNFLSNRLNFGLEFFNNETRDILLQLPVPATYGLGQPFQNAGTVRNRGWEVTVEYLFDTGEVQHSINANISDNLNEVIDLKGREFVAGGDVQTILREGYPMYSYYGLKSDGFFNSNEEVANHATPIFATSVKAGDIRYIDRNQDGDIDYEGDRFILSNPFPRYTFGFSYGMKWKGFDFSFLLQGVGKRSQWVRGEIVEAFHNSNEGPVFNRHLDRWTPTNTDASYPRLTIGSESVNNAARSDFWIFDAKYMRIKNIQLGYTLPQSIIRKAGLTNVRFYVTGLNVLTFTPFDIGLDPEVNGGIAAGGAPYSGRVYPVARVFSGGVDIKF